MAFKMLIHSFQVYIWYFLWMYFRVSFLHTMMLIQYIQVWHLFFILTSFHLVLVCSSRISRRNSFQNVFVSKPKLLSNHSTILKLQLYFHFGLYFFHVWMPTLENLWNCLKHLIASTLDAHFRTTRLLVWSFVLNAIENR